MVSLQLKSLRAEMQTFVTQAVDRIGDVVDAMNVSCTPRETTRESTNTAVARASEHPAARMSMGAPESAGVMVWAADASHFQARRA